MKATSMNKKVLTSSIALALFPTSSFAGFGFGDFNITEIPSYMAKTVELIQAKLEEAMPAAMQGVQFQQQTRMQDIVHQANVAMKTMPSSDACEKVLQHQGIQQALASAGQQSQKLHEKTQKTLTKTFSESNRTLSQLQALELTCSEEQIKTNENQCAKLEGKGGTNLMAEKDKNYGSLYGANATIKKNGQEVSYTTGGIIPRQKWLGEDYKGEAVVDLVVNRVAGQPAISITNKMINNSARGQIYNNKASDYQARNSIILRHAADVAGDSMELDDAAGEKVKDFWLSSEVQDTMKLLKGENYNITKDNKGGKLNPSYMAMLEASVIGQFNTSNAITRALSESKTESDLLVVNNYLLLKLFQEQRKTNDFLSALLSQSLDPVNSSTLKSLKDSAEGQVISR